MILTFISMTFRDNVSGRQPLGMILTFISMTFRDNVSGRQPLGMFSHSLWVCPDHKPYKREDA